MVHPAKEYIAGKKLKAMLNVCLGQGIRNYYLSPTSKTPLEAQGLGEERSYFFIALIRRNEKGSPPQAGSLLFIATGSVDMDISDLLLPCSVSLGLLRPGVRSSFSLHASTLKPEEPSLLQQHPLSSQMPPPGPGSRQPRKNAAENRL